MFQPHNEERLSHWRLLRSASSEKVRRASGVLGCSNGDRLCYIRMLQLHFPCQSNLAFALISVHFWLVQQEVKLQSKAWWPHRCCLYLSRRLITSAGAQRLLVERGNHIAYPPDIASTLSQWHWTLLPLAFFYNRGTTATMVEKKKGLLEN